MTVAPWWQDEQLVRSQERLAAALQAWLDTRPSTGVSARLSPEHEESLRAYLEAEATYRCQLARVTGD